MVAPGVALVELPVVDGVVGQQDDEQVIPAGRGLQLVDEVADALVEVVEGVHLLIRELV